MGLDHEAITKVMTSQGGYGTGVWPNLFLEQEPERARRNLHAEVLGRLQRKADSLFEPRFISSPITSEAIAALITLTDSRSVLELGSHTGATTLYIIKALYGKEGARIVTIDPDPCHDVSFFVDFSNIHIHIKDSTPGALSSLVGKFDLVFVDSLHTLEHTSKELDALMSITHSGSVFLFHDVPAWMGPDNPYPHPVREWLLREPRLQGLCLPSGEQLDCLAVWGDGYDKRCNPGLGIFIKK